MLDLDAYFDTVRDSLFQGSLTQQQVDGQVVILAVWAYQKQEDARKLAYMLATVFHETATRMWPIEEYGKGKGHDYAEPDENGNSFYGRGFVQLTWKSNYDRASSELSLYDDRDLTQHPQLALDSLIATRVMFTGMAEGWFTGVSLSDYFNESEDDPVNARRVINGNDQDDLIAGYHGKFLDALEAAKLEVVADA